MPLRAKTTTVLIDNATLCPPAFSVTGTLIVIGAVDVPGTAPALANAVASVPFFTDKSSPTSPGFAPLFTAKRTFGYLGYYVWWRVGRWLRKKHPRMTWKQIKRRYLNDDHTFQADGITLYKPASMRVTRYRYRGARIPNPWRTADLTGPRAEAASLQEQLPLERVQQALA